jgi:predicted nucleotidyltransferase
VSTAPRRDRLAERVVELVSAHPAVRAVRLVGSRAEGRATALSDWDFVVETDDFAAVAEALPRLLAPLEPLGQQWDRLSREQCWMLTLAGPTKVDLIFAEPHTEEPPWELSAANLGAIDVHFWDWALWLNAKESRGDPERLDNELKLLFEHLLAPLGVERQPASVAEAVEAYCAARGLAERRFGVAVDRRLEAAVAPALARMPV